MDLNAFVGEWTTEATHPAVPGTVVRGEAVFEWLEGERFLILRARNEHPDFPTRSPSSGPWFAEDGNTITGLFTLSRDDSTWDGDLEITYRRSS